MDAVVVRDPANAGFETGNTGMVLARTYYVLLINPDSELVSRAVEEGTAVLDAEPRVAACQG